jgi:AraC-like DNA-binding protein
LKEWAMSETSASRDAGGQSSGPATMRFRTDAFPAHERLPAMHEMFGLGVLKLRIDPLSQDAFRSDVTIRLLPGLGVMKGMAQALRFDRPRHLIDNDDIVLAICLSGESRFNVRGREPTLRPGEAILMGAGQGGYNDVPVPSRYITLRAPRRAIAAIRTPGDMVGRPICAPTPALRLLTDYVGIIDTMDELPDPQLQHRLATHIHGLIALTLGAVGDADDAARDGVRSARLRAVKADIAKRLDDPDLSVAAIAALHRCTPRYIQALFEHEGTTFTAYVLEQRLARVHRLLTDPRRAHEKVSALAFDAGFGNLSYFNRAFRARYGFAPSDLRAAARPQ